jgi:NAD(P)-dependent dehydrogenase (short-subunit alcohol dehydrogenase family)
MMSDRTTVVLVTGATSGFGRAISLALHERGYRVYGTTRQADVAGNPHGQYRLLSMNVNDDESVKSAIGRLLAQEGRLGAVINNAGAGIAGAIEDTDIGEARAQLETNFFGTHRVCRAVLPHMRAQGGGRIINMSSLGGLVAIPFQAFYCASKYAIEAYTEALRMEVRTFGIQVSMVEPGDFATSFTSNRRMTAASTASSPYQQRCTAAVSQMAADESRNTNIAPVVTTVINALESRNPRLRYPVATAVQRILVALKPFIPQSTFEYLLMDNYKIG